jgi:L-amino acid N-acyltransferase YncA
MKSNILNITMQKNMYKSHIENFLDSLDDEKKYFKLDRERFSKFELTLAAFDNDNKIIGLAGLECKLGFVRTLISICKECQGEGLGKKLLLQLIIEAKKKYNIILAVTEEENYRAENLHYSIGFKKVGKKENLVYSFKPLNFKGLLVYYFFRMVFPIIKILDWIRRI